MHNDFYVYVHRRKSDSEVFYVGKGRRYRATSKANRNKWWCAIEAKHGFHVEFVEKGLTEEDAHVLEIETIKFYRENGHKLCNITDGGEGVTGLVRKQPITDGAEIDLNITIPDKLRNKTRSWDMRKKLPFHVVVTNLLLHGKVYYSRMKSKSERTDRNRRGLSCQDIKVAIEKLVELGYATKHTTSIKDSVKTMSSVSATDALYLWLNGVVVKTDVSC